MMFCSFTAEPRLLFDRCRRVRRFRQLADAPFSPNMLVLSFSSVFVCINLIFIRRIEKTENSAKSIEPFDHGTDPDDLPRTMARPRRGGRRRGYAAAAEAIHKSQSAVTYAVQQVEKLLGVKAFRLEGRKAVLTPAGRMLYSRARVLLDEASSLERAAQRNSAGWEAEITIAVEIIFPTWLLLKCLDPLRTRGAEYTHRGDRDGARRGA